MRRLTPLVGAVAAAFVAGCASLDDSKSAELYDSNAQTGTHIDRPGLPPNMMDQNQIQRAFRNSGSAMVPDPAPQ
jgi:hypothetical protein